MRIGPASIPSAVIAVSLAVALLGSGCSSGGDGASASNPAPAPTTPSASPPTCPPDFSNQETYTGSTEYPALILCDTSPSAAQGTAELVNSSDYQFFAVGALPLERILPDVLAATATDAPSDLALNVVFSNDDRVDSNATVLMAPNSRMQVSYLNGLSVTVSEDTASEGEYLFLLWTFGGAKDALSDSVFESLNPAGEFGTCAWDVYQSWSQVKHPDYKNDGSVNSDFTDLYNEAVTYQTAVGLVDIADVCGAALDGLTGSDSASKKVIADAATEYSKAIVSPEVKAGVADGAEDSAVAIDDIVEFIEEVIEGIE